MIRASAPGRVNLIGEHTDTTGGLALPMAIQLGTVVTGERGGDRVVLTSDADDEPLDLPLEIGDPATVSPPWARYVAGVVAELRPAAGFTGSVTTDLPVGAGLSSSAALEVAVALALGFDGGPRELALACQRAERRASGVPCGVMDQLASGAGVAGHALLLDCATLDATTVAIPADVEIVAVHSGESRSLATSAYADRRATCAAAERIVGPLRDIVDVARLDEIDDPVVRRRARHVVSENERVRAFAAALQAGDLQVAGDLMAASHASLAEDFEVSTAGLDALVADLSARPAVFGARLTGAGFGGCAVALCRPGAIDLGWRLRPSAGASVAGT